MLPTSNARIDTADSVGASRRSNPRFQCCIYKCKLPDDINHESKIQLQIAKWCAICDEFIGADVNFATTPLSAGPYQPKRRNLAAMVLRKVLEKASPPANEHHDAEHCLDRSTDPAVERGLFGPPAVFVGNEIFWRNDRVDFIEEALRKFIWIGAKTDASHSDAKGEVMIDPESTDKH
jgi:hypothetical protein